MDDWCPENDGAYRAEMAAMYPVANRKRIAELEAERDAALVALFECMEEIDAYIQQEYPQDHPVHERYRQRDYSANPARIFLRDRPDALVKARAMLAEADLKRQAAELMARINEGEKK